MAPNVTPSLLEAEKGLNECNCNVMRIGELSGKRIDSWTNEPDNFSIKQLATNFCWLTGVESLASLSF